MASIVTDVLKNSGLLEKEDLSTRIGKLASRIDETKAEVYSTVQDKYVDFKPNLNKTLDLSGRVKVLSTDTQSLASKIKGEISSQLNSSTSDLHDLTHQLDKTNALIDMLHTLCQVQEDLEQFEKSLNAQDFLQASKHVDNTKQNVALLVQGGYCDLKIVRALEAERCIHHETLIYHLEEMWTAALKWNLPSAKETLNAKNVSKIRLTISHSNNLASAMQAMEQVGILKLKLQAFGKKLVQFIITPLITFGGCAFNTGKSDEETGIFLRCKKSASGNEHNDPQAVYNNLRILFETMKVPLLNTVVQSEQDSVKISSMLGCLIWKDIADLLITKCLVHSIPTTSSQLEKYKAVIEATQQFEKYLQQIGFIHELTSPLLSYARNVNLHFANRKCQEITIKARELMKKELHNTMFVGTEDVTEAKEEDEDEDKSDQKKDVKQSFEANSQQKHLGDGVLRFPYCAVSESIQQLITLAYETLQDAVTDTPQCAIQLFYTVRNVFELFCDIVPTYHRDSIEKLPQVSAVHHNNCMLIAHYLMTLGHQYRQSLPPPLSQGAATFVDLIPVFRKLASECFLAQMRTQRSQLIESLSEAATFDRVAEETNKNVTEKAIKRTVHQLKHLQRVWGLVLPNHVYTKAMATLANTVLIHIVEKITALEDISADDAHTLYSLLSVLQVELPSIVTPKPESQTGGIVETQVESWMSFKELLFILEASLQDIVDRWADGKGPLALAFSSTEVKSMIRALFQNTDRRATALSKIKKT